MIGAAFLVALLTNQPAAPAPCAHDRAALLALDQQAFDQDMEGGWRMLARDPACYLAAADLIRDYRAMHGLTDTILFWHEGQMRAQAGQDAAAAALFEQSRKPPGDPFGWNFYVEASLAFLRRDRFALLAAREALARLPRPADFDPRDARGQPVQVRWPPNLNVVDGLIACFGQSYRAAYNCPARPAAR